VCRVCGVCGIGGVGGWVVVGGLVVVGACYRVCYGHSKLGFKIKLDITVFAIRI